MELKNFGLLLTAWHQQLSASKNASCYLPELGCLDMPVVLILAMFTQELIAEENIEASIRMDCSLSSSPCLLSGVPAVQIDYDNSSENCQKQ